MLCAKMSYAHLTSMVMIYKILNEEIDYEKFDF